MSLKLLFLTLCLFFVLILWDGRVNLVPVALSWAYNWLFQGKIILKIINMHGDNTQRMGEKKWKYTVVRFV